MVELVVWLLQWDALIRLHHFVVMLPAVELGESTSEREYLKSNSAPVSPEESDALNWSDSASPGEGSECDGKLDQFNPTTDGAWLLEARSLYVEQHADGDSRAYQLLSKLWKYFDGKHVLEEIM